MMQTAYRSRAFNTPAAIKRSRLLPFKFAKSLLSTCNNCNFVNLTSHNYCTNCGYPLLANKDQLTLYNYRLKLRKDMLKKAEQTVQFARNTLYIIAILCVLGAVFVFADIGGMLTAVVLLVVAALFAGLGRWSLVKPFTAL